MKKTLLFAAFALFTSLFCNAEEAVKDAIYVWVDGQSTCYKLEAMPKVVFEDGSAVLTLNDDPTPVLTLKLDGEAQLKVTFGVYDPTPVSIKSPVSKVTQDGKFIRGGKLIIIKDGKMYDAKGRVI